MNDNTMKQPLAIVTNSTVIALLGIAIFAIMIREQRPWRDGLLGASDSAFYGAFAVGIAATLVLRLLFKHYQNIDQHLRQLVSSVLARLGNQRGMEIEELKISAQEHHQSQSKLDDIINRLYTDEPDWANPYWLLSTLKCELQKLEYRYCNRFIILEYLSFLNTCTARLEEFAWPDNYFAIVQSVRMGGDEFLEQRLYPYIAKALSEAASGADDAEIQRRVIRLYVTDNEHRHLFPDVAPTMASRLDKVQLVNLATLDTCCVGEYGGDNG